MDALALAQQMQRGGNPGGFVPTGMVSTGIGKTVTLPDGTIIEKSATKIVFKGPGGGSCELKPPPVFEPGGWGSTEPVTKSGWLYKLSYRKGFFGGEVWQRRYCVLQGHQIAYSSEEGQAEPNKVVPIVYGGQSKVIRAGEPRRKDAFDPKDTRPGVFTMMTMNIGAMADQYQGVIGRDSIAVHKPIDPVNMLNSVMGMSAFTLAFGGGVEKIHEQNARTWYFAADSEEELTSWEQAITNNFLASKATGAIGVFQRYIGMVGGSTEGVDLMKILCELYGVSAGGDGCSIM